MPFQNKSQIADAQKNKCRVWSCNVFFLLDVNREGQERTGYTNQNGQKQEVEDGEGKTLHYKKKQFLQKLDRNTETKRVVDHYWQK